MVEFPDLGPAVAIDQRPGAPPQTTQTPRTPELTNLQRDGDDQVHHA